MPKKGQSWTPEQRANILAAKQAKKEQAAREQDGFAQEQVSPAQPEQQVQEAAPVLPRQRAPLKALPGKPKGGARWRMKAGNNWDDDLAEDIPDTAPNELHIPLDMIPEGMSLQWITTEVYGKEENQRRALFERTGWTAVHPEDFDGLYDGRWSSRGTKGEINYFGLTLVAKPTELVERSRKRDEREARRRVQIKEQALFGGEHAAPVMGADHPSAKRFNHINRSVERVTIPED